MEKKTRRLQAYILDTDTCQVNILQIKEKLKSLNKRKHKKQIKELEIALEMEYDFMLECSFFDDIQEVN